MTFAQKTMRAFKGSVVTLGWSVIFFLTFTASVIAVASEQFYQQSRVVGPILFQLGILAILKGLLVMLNCPQRPVPPALRDVGLGLVVVAASILTMPGLGGCFSLDSCR